MSMVWPTLGSSTAKELNRITVSLMSVCVCVTVPTLVEMLKDIESPYEVSLLPYLHYTSIRMARVVSVLDSGAEGPGFKLQSRCCRVTVLGKLFTPIVPLFTKQRNW